MENKKGKIWSEEDIEFLKLNYASMTKKELGSIIGRTEAAVTDKAKLIGVGRKNLNSRFNKETRICVICKNEFPRTAEYFTTFIAKRDKEVFQNKCRPCEKVYVQEKSSTPIKTFKGILRNIKSDSKRTQNGFDIDLEYLLYLWDEQKQLCAISSIEMTTLKGKGVYYYSNVSVDKIIPELGYIKTNVQLVCSWANTAKSNLSIDDFKRMITLTYEKINNG
jgi:hypothetical protein